MRRGSGTLTARPRAGVAVLAAVVAAGALLYIPAPNADAALDVVLPVSGVCTVAGTVTFSPALPKLPQSDGVDISVSGGCSGVGVGGAMVSIQMGDTPTASCAAIEGVLAGTVSFTGSGNIPSYAGHGNLVGNVATLDFEIADAAQQFFGSLQLVDTTLLAADTCAAGSLGSITVTGTFTFATL
jgi:hypothetical protein